MPTSPPTAAGRAPAVQAGRPVRIMLVDDDAMVRTGVRGILAGAENLEVVAEAKDGSEVVPGIYAHQPDVVFMDLQMPHTSGVEAILQVQKLANPPKIIALTSFDYEDYVYQALEAGAVGFLLKDSTPQELIEAVGIVMRGDSILSPRSTRQLVNHFGRNADAIARQQAREMCAMLTERELEVAVLIGKTLSNGEIATQLYCSTATVKTHLAKLMPKLDATNRMQVGLTLQKAGLV